MSSNGKQGKSVLFAYGFSSSTYILGRLSTSLISFPLYFFFFKVWGRCLFMLGLHACWLRSILWVVNVQQTSQLWTAQCSAQLDDTLTPLSVRLCFYNLGQLKWSNLVIDVSNAINREAILTFITFPYCLSTPFISRKAIGHSYKYSLH